MRDLSPFGPFICFEIAIQQNSEITLSPQVTKIDWHTY